MWVVSPVYGVRAYVCVCDAFNGKEMTRERNYVAACKRWAFGVHRKCNTHEHPERVKECSETYAVWYSYGRMHSLHVQCVHGVFLHSLFQLPNAHGTRTHSSARTAISTLNSQQWTLNTHTIRFAFSELTCVLLEEEEEEMQREKNVDSVGWQVTKKKK